MGMFLRKQCPSKGVYFSVLNTHTSGYTWYEVAPPPQAIDLVKTGSLDQTLLVIKDGYQHI